MVSHPLLAFAVASQSKQVLRTSRTFLIWYGALGLTSLALLTACGGGGGGGGAGDKNPVDITFAPSAQLAKICASPDPALGEKPGTVENEKAWVRSYIDERYLWYKDVPNLDASQYATVQAYFDVLKTSAKNSAGEDLDRFHFSYTTQYWNQYSSGVSLDYGIEWASIKKSPPRNFVVLNVEPNSPAAKNGVARGDKLVALDGIDFINSGDATGLTKGLFPNDSALHSFVFQRGQESIRLNMQTAEYDATPVRLAKLLPSNTAYLYFDAFIAKSQDQLIQAFSDFKSQGATDLVLDMRYNGGGLLYISSQLAYLIAGPLASDGKIFYKTTYNDKRTKDSFTYPFIPYALTSSNAYDRKRPLPSLNLRRVTLLVDHGTASASEALINGLRGIGVQVNLIGSTTYGKPYGFNAADNCGRTYFAVEFKGENNQGFADYDAGFAPTCTVKDDPAYPLGDATEPRLAEALQYLSTGKCSANPVASMKAIAAPQNNSSVFEPNPMRLLSIHTKIKP